MGIVELGARVYEGRERDSAGNCVSSLGDVGNFQRRDARTFRAGFHESF